jgi:hypothetical protein
MAQEFKLIADSVPTVYKVVTIASQAYAIGDAVQWSRTAADVTPATSSTITANIAGVAVSAQTSADTTLLIALASDTQTWAADATNAPNITHNYQRMALTDKGTVNNTGSDQTGTSGIFEQTGIYPGGVTTRIVGRFLVGHDTT